MGSVLLSSAHELVVRELTNSWVELSSPSGNELSSWVKGPIDIPTGSSWLFGHILKLSLWFWNQNHKIEFASMTHFMKHVVSVLWHMFIFECDFTSFVDSYGAHYIFCIHIYISSYFHSKSWNFDISILCCVSSKICAWWIIGRLVLFTWKIMLKFSWNNLQKCANCSSLDGRFNFKLVSNISAYHIPGPLALLEVECVNLCVKLFYEIMRGSKWVLEKWVFEKRPKAYF